MRRKFSELSSLVLVDTLAALPMEHVVRMARLGHERLRQTCSLTWVTDRMTDVTFRKIVRARLAGDDMRQIFCSDSVMKGARGKVGVSNVELRKPHFTKACVETAQKMIGRFHLCLEGGIYDSIENFQCSKLLAALSQLCYTSQTVKRGTLTLLVMPKFPKVYFNYIHYPFEDKYLVLYRPELLNGRHVVDVLRAVCGPADVSEAELDRVRREATEKAFSVEFRGKWWKGVWQTQWLGVAVVVHA